MTDTSQYGVLNPWAEADPVPMKGISPRLDSLEGKKIGLFQNFKQASKQMTATIGEKLKERYPGIETFLFDSTDQNVNVIETDKKDEFIKWAEGIDAAILLVGN
ncbi:MAG: hypothetical protein JW712_13035 [Dehalococcoidales bacterium]|nr:hypothetical protein [Dehalococcoidales bacterium]